MSIRKRVKAIFTKPERKLVELAPEFWQLREELVRLLEADDPLIDIVHFFDIVSKWHDRVSVINDLIRAFEDVNNGQYDEVVEQLRTLKTHFVKAGRCEEDGWNRTKRDETVTADKVLLGGNMFGLRTMPVSFWITRKDDPKNAWKGGMWDNHPEVIGKNASDVISDRAYSFMADHAYSMIAILNNLLGRRRQRV